MNDWLILSVLSVIVFSIPLYDIIFGRHTLYHDDKGKRSLKSIFSMWRREHGGITKIFKKEKYQK